MIKSIKAAVFTFCFFFAFNVFAHEYWLMPIKFQNTLGSSALINIKNGQDFAGNSFPYQPKQYSEHALINDAGTQEITSRLGDFPALHPTLTVPGVQSVVLSTNREEIIYPTWERFEKFLSYHGLLDFIEIHNDRGLPQEGVVEHYYRFAKTYFKVDAEDHLEADDQVEAEAKDEVKDEDEIKAGLAEIIQGDQPSTADRLSSLPAAMQPQGHRLDMVFVANPFVESQTFSIQLLYEGEPLPNRQVELFSRTDNVVRTITTTNEQGIAKFENVVEGVHMINAVHLLEPTSEDADWETLWASVTLKTGR